MMEKAQRLDQASRRVAFALQLVVVAMLYFFLYVSLTEPELARGRVYLAILPVWFLGLYFAILIHELGHVRAGLKGGMEFRQMHIGPVGISRSAGRTDVFLTRQRLMGGFAYMAMPDGRVDVDVLQRFIRGGPVASIYLSTLLAFVCFGFVAFGLQTGTMLAGSVFLGSLLGLTGTVIPYTARGMQTDALLLDRLGKPGDERDLVVANFLLSAETLAGVRARDWTPSAVDVLLKLSRSQIDRFRALYVAFIFYADSGENQKARESLEQLDEIAKDHPDRLGLIVQSFWLQKAFLLADERMDYAGARQLLARVTSRAEILESDRLLAEAAIAVGEGSREAAETKLNRAEQALQRLKLRMGCNIEPDSEKIARLRVRAGISGKC